MDGQMFIINQYYVLLWQQKKVNYLVDTNDTQSDYASGNSYTVEYLKNVVKNSIINCEKEFTCIVRSLISDNTFNKGDSIHKKKFLNFTTNFQKEQETSI